MFVTLLAVSGFAQNIYVYPAAATAPRGSYQTVTAIVNGVNDKTVTWSSDSGTIVGTNPCVANEPCTVALYTTTTGTYHLTATSNANHAITASSTLTFTNSPAPRTDHPRFVLTSSMLSSLQAKAAGTDPMYQAIKTMATNSYNNDNAIWSWSCNGGTGKPSSDQSQSWKEGDGYLFAIMSEIAPTATERNQWGCYGHDVFMTMAGYVLSGALDLSQGNHWSDSARAITLTPDLLMGGGYLSSTADLNTTRQYLARIAYEQITDIYNGTLASIGTYNDPYQLQESNENSTTGMRAMGNNYTQSRILYLTAAALTFNDTPTDDPPLANTCNATRYQVCPDGTAGSLHAYWTYVAGGMLYKDWANLEDPVVAQKAYNATFGNLPTQPMCNTLWHASIPCFGQGRGGEPSEGTSYGASLSRLRWAMSAIHNAGYDDPILYGPQISIGTSSYWDLRYVADLNLLTGLSGIPSEKSRWNFLTDGDTLYYFAYPSNYVSESAILAADSYVGRTDRNAALKWLVMNTAFGMASGTAGACGSYCGFDAELSNDYASDTALDMFIALPAADPVTSNPPADPRQSLPTDWYDAANQHIVVRNGWGTDTNTIFSYYCPNTQIDHEHEYCGGFSVYSDGEYITKGRNEFNDYVNEYSAARNQNVPALMNTPTDTSCTYVNGCYWADMTQLGGQFWHGYQAGLASLQHSEVPGYVAAIADSTNVYNGGWGGFGNLNGITHASRSLIYLRGSNQVVYYDRGLSGSNSWGKANYLVATGAPSVNGNTASWLTRSGQQRVFWTSLAPAGSAPTLDATYSGSSHASDDWEIYGRLKVDAGNVAAARFLSVLQWGSTASSAPSASLIKSISGNSFDGALVGSSLAMFIRTPGSFTGTTYPASGATTHYISDLSPNTTYAISATGAPTSATTDNAGVLTFTAAGTGNVTIGTGSAPVSVQSIAVTPSTATVQTLGSQQFVANCSYSDGSSADCTTSVNWASSSTSVVTINGSGVATGVAQGTANIIANMGSVQAQASATVPAAVLQTISITPASSTVAVGGTQQLKATGVYSDSSTVDMTNAVNWSSSNPAVVSTTTAGLACALAQGTANVTAASGTIHGQASLTVAQAAVPTFTPAPGTYTSAQSVTISTTTTAATIHYTTDGSTPTANSTVYSGPIAVSTSQTINAIAVASGYSNSTVATGAYTINLASVTPTFNPAGGTYSSAQTVTVASSTPSAVIYYTTDGSTPTTSSAVYAGPIAVSTSETVKAIAVASGYSKSAVGSASYTINIQAATPSFNPAGGSFTSAQTVTISTSSPGATIYFTTNGSTPTTSSSVYAGPITVSSSETVKAVAVANGYATSSVGSATYTFTVPTPAAPSFSPAPGKYTSVQSVTISTSTPSATIYYTTDGSKPSTSSPVYTGPIVVSSSTTIKAFADSGATRASSTTTGNYMINLPTVATPSFSPGGGKYTSVQTVSISTSTPGATIYFTTDGTTPTTNSSVYAGPITVGVSETVKAMAVETGYKSSSVNSASYTINLPAPSFSVKVSNSSVTVARGHASLTNVSIIPVNGFSAPVALSCSGLPVGATCKFSPEMVTPPGVPASTTLTVTVAAEVASSSHSRLPALPGSAAMAALGFCYFGRKRRSAFRLLSVGLAGVLGLSLCIGCGAQSAYSTADTSMVTVVGMHDSMQPTTATFNLTFQ
jgi:hypothetical protein